MRILLNIPKSKNALILIVGILAGMTVLSGQIYDKQFTPSIEVAQESTTDDDNKPEQQSVVKAVYAVATTVHVNLVHQFYFINEILHTEEHYEESTYFELPKLSTFFTTLFRQIISPNAP